MRSMLRRGRSSLDVTDDHDFADGAFDHDNDGRGSAADLPRTAARVGATA
jgi:hypothetical protein